MQRRWKSLRDRFTRYVAELAKQQKSGAGAEDTIPDVTLPYFEQMLFLKDTVAHRQYVYFTFLEFCLEGGIQRYIEAFHAHF